MHSIRTKIIAVTIAAILTSVLALFGANVLTVGVDNDRRTTEMMTLLCNKTQLVLDEYLKSVEQSVETVANIASETLDSVVLAENGAVGSAAKQSQRTPEQSARLDEYLAANLVRVQEAFSSVANHTQGIVTYYYCVTPEISQNEHGFFYSRVGKTGFEKQPPLDARELDPEDLGHTTWYYTPIQRGRPSWVGPYTAYFLNEVWTNSYLVPIYRAGTLIGVLGMDLLHETLVDQLRSIRVYKTGFACLYDEQGHVLYHPELEMGAVPDTPEGAAVMNIFTQKDSGEKLIRYTIHGQERQLAFATLANGMKLVVTAPVEEITASWRSLNHIILLITLVIVGIFTVILGLMLGLITRPLQRLTAASQRLADGDYDVELSYTGKDEVGTLTGAFSRMREHLQHYISDLNRRVDTDDLTGLANMGHFFTLAEAGRERMLAAGQYPALLYIDLVGMKHYNQQYGFEEGNRLLLAVAELLSQRFGAENCSRFGQDHFAVVTGETGLEERLNRFLEDCAALNDGKSLPVRVGVYPHRVDAVNVSVACDRAKYACDRHRGTYASGFYYFDEKMLRQVENQGYIIDNLDRALSEGWVRVYYQPIVRAANGRVCDEEALSRWFDPVKGMLSPDQFIPVLEDARLIYRLDLYVLSCILQKMQEQQQAGLYLVPQSLNLSRMDFDSCDIVEEVRRRVDKAGIPRDKLTIEITESTVGSDFDFMKKQVERFRELGFKVWMDDFGSGYSALDTLQDIRFDLIKFDMRFMQRFGETEESQIILTELVKMAIGLGIDTVIEGVETAEQTEFLKEIGCTKLQGYYFCKPIPKEAILERYQKGVQIGYENPAETGYYTAIGKINLYDLAAASNDSEGLKNYFAVFPMAVVEYDGKESRVIRCNQAYRELKEQSYEGRGMDRDMLRRFSGERFSEAVAQCREAGAQVFLNETLPDGTEIHAMVRHVATNPVNGIVACMLVVLGVTEPGDAGA